MIPDIQITDHLDGPFKGKKKIIITCEQEDLDRFKKIVADSFGAMKDAINVRNLMHGGLSQLVQAAKMIGAKK